MANIYQGVPPSTLTAVARYILTEEDQQDQIAAEDPQAINSLGPWFPMETTDGIEVEWDEGLDTPYTPSVPLRAFDTPPPEGTLPGVTHRTAKMIPMGITYKIGELDMILQRAAQGSDEEALMERTAFTAIERGMRGVINRAELLKSNLLVDAQLAIDENGVVETVTVGRDAGNSITSATAWSDTANADPHDDEHGAVDLLESTYGLAWDDVVVLTNRLTFNHYRTIDAVASELPTNRQLTGRVSTDEVNDLRAGRELPPVIILNRQVRDTTGTLQYLIPTNTWMIVPRPGIALGRTVWGSPASLMLDGVDIARDDRPGPVALIEEHTGVPPARKTVIDALGMPFLQAPNWTVNLTTQAGL